MTSAVWLAGFGPYAEMERVADRERTKNVRDM